MRRITLGMLAGGLLMAGVTHAQPPAAETPAAPTPAAQAADDLTAPCRADVHKLCKGIEPGGGRIKQCLREHASDLSPACRKRLHELASSAAESGATAWRRACHDDIGTICKGVEPGGGRVVACLRGHADQVSPACKASLPPS